MISYRLKRTTIAAFTVLLSLVLFTGCGGSNTSPTLTKSTPPTPTPDPGQRLLTQTANAFKTAKTFHGILNVNITGRVLNGTLKSEIWNEAPTKSRTLVSQSTVSQVTAGSITVTDGKQIWQYDPLKKVVYHGPVPTSTDGTPTTGAAGNGIGQSRFLLGLIQTIFARSDGTLQPSSLTIDGHTVTDIHVSSQTDAADSGQGVGSFSYTGEIYLDKTTQLPVKLDLDIQGLGKVVLDLPMLELNQNISDDLFTFHIPSGVKELPLQQATASATTGSLTLVQAQRQAGYHLLSIPGDQAEYVLLGVDALGAPGNQIYTLNYMKGSTSFSIAQGKSLANLPGTTGKQVDLRGTKATLSTINGATTLAWTEKGIGLRITGNLSGDQMVSIANMLT